MFAVFSAVFLAIAAVYVFRARVNFFGAAGRHCPGRSAGRG